jgi:KDO2-lipid IV(A) lauroyltransferase
MFVLRLISKLPLGVLYIISDLIYLFTYYILKYRRKVVMTNLQNSFPQKSKKELEQISKKFFRNLSDYAAETLRLLSMSREELRKRVVFTNPEIIKEYTGKNQSVLLFASHQFNWEWTLAGGSLYLPAPLDFVYLPQKSELANTFALAIRTRFGAHAIPRESVGREAIRRKDIIRATAIVADQYPGHSNHRKYWATFLGQRTAFFHGILQLAVLQNAGSYFGDVKKISRGHYEVTLIELKGPDIIDRYIEESEKMINREPDGWLWSHRRWKNLEY